MRYLHERILFGFKSAIAHQLPFILRLLAQPDVKPRNPRISVIIRNSRIPHIVAQGLLASGFRCTAANPMVNPRNLQFLWIIANNLQSRLRCNQTFGLRLARDFFGYCTWIVRKLRFLTSIATLSRSISYRYLCLSLSPHPSPSLRSGIYLGVAFGSPFPPKGFIPSRMCAVANLRFAPFSRSPVWKILARIYRAARVMGIREGIPSK